jgi:two-component system sensor histidine kinase AlgZ
MSPNSSTVAFALPDFRNLGVAARILVGVNLAAFVAAGLKANTFAQLMREVLDIALVLEPALIGSLAVLSAASPWLARLPYAIGLGTVTAVVLVVTAGAWLLGSSVDAAPQGVVRAGAFALLTIGVLAGYFHLRDRAFSPALAEARLQALQARIRPHFLFNTLNAVLSLIRKDARRAESAIEDLAELYRMVLADAKNLTTLARELDLTRQYLNLEQLRLGDRLVVDWQTADAPRDALVPPLLLQPLVENAVYHGIARDDRDRDPARPRPGAREAHESVSPGVPAPAGEPHRARQHPRAARAALRRRRGAGERRERDELRDPHDDAVPARRAELGVRRAGGGVKEHREIPA